MSAYLDENYFKWLCSHIYSSREKNPSKTYENLLHLLFTKEFVWLVPNDDNRVEDGQDYRRDFVACKRINLEGWDEAWLELGCSVFELLLGLSRRLSFETDEPEVDWFFELLRNLGLDEYNDTVDIPLYEVDEILDTFIWRNYDHTGHGGLFPLQNPRKDQRKVELWYQLSAYILERQ